MKQFKIKQFIPASIINTITIEAATPEEAFEKLKHKGGKIISTKTYEILEDIEYNYPEEI